MSRTMVEEEMVEEEDELVAPVPTAAAKKVPAAAASKKVAAAAPKKATKKPREEAEAEPAAAVAAPAPKKKSKKVAEPPPKDKEEADVVAVAPKKVKAPKKKAAAAAAPALVEQQDDDDEPAPVEDVEPVAPKKERKRHPARAKGSRFARVTSYRAELAKDRKKNAVGKDPAAPRIRHHPGFVVKNEIRALRKSNGVYVGHALAHRLVSALAAAYVDPYILNEEAFAAARLGERGKKVPLNFHMDGQTSFGSNTVVLFQGLAHDELCQLAARAGEIAGHSKRKTVTGADVRLVAKQHFGIEI